MRTFGELSREVHLIISPIFNICNRLNGNDQTKYILT